MAKKYKLLIEPTSDWHENMLRIAELATGIKSESFFRQDMKTVHDEMQRVKNSLDEDKRRRYVQEELDLDIDEADIHEQRFSSEEAARKFKYLCLPEERAALAYCYLLKNSPTCERLLGMIRQAALLGKQLDLDYEIKTIKRQLKNEGWSGREINDEFRYVGKWLCAFKRLAILCTNDIKHFIVPISACSVSAVFPECRPLETKMTAGEYYDLNED